MPKTGTRPGRKSVGLDLTPALVDQMRALAERNGRTFREEVEHAFQRHLAAPPTVRITVDVQTPPLADVVAQESASEAESKPAAQDGRKKTRTRKE